MRCLSEKLGQEAAENLTTYRYKRLGRINGYKRYSNRTKIAEM